MRVNAEMNAYRNFKDYHIEQLRDPEDAKVYLSVALDDYEKNGDIEAFLLVVRDVAEAQGNSRTDWLCVPYTYPPRCGSRFLVLTFYFHDRILGGIILMLLKSVFGQV